MKGTKMRVAAPLAAVTIAATGLTVLAQAQASAASLTITLVSVSSTGDQGNGFSFSSALSSDGRYVAFSSDASNLAPGDPSAESDVFLRDTLAGTTEMVSVSSVGEPGNGRSVLPDISADGRFVVFESGASNLVAGDLNGVTDVFVRDRQTAATSLASVSTTGEPGNGASEHAVVSADGRYVAFSSQATNLVEGDTNAVSDIFVRDLSAGTTTRVSVSSSGTQSNGGFNLWPSLSASGDKVAFGSGATNLDPLDTNGRGDVYVHDRISGITSVASVSSAGELSNGFSFHAALSGDGNTVAFISSGSNLIPEDTNGVQDVFVRDLVAGITERVSVTSNEKEGTDYSEVPDISGDGRFVAFYSPAVLTPKDGNLTGDVFLRDRLRGTTVRISSAPKGKDPNGGSASPAINGLGTQVSFESVASNLVPNDVNDASDIFLYRSGS